jgi:hypothetical protein
MVAQVSALIVIENIAINQNIEISPNPTPERASPVRKHLQQFSPGTKL